VHLVFLIPSGKGEEGPDRPRGIDLTQQLIIIKIREEGKEKSTSSQKGKRAGDKLPKEKKTFFLPSEKKFSERKDRKSCLH